MPFISMETMNYCFIILNGKHNIILNFPKTDLVNLIFSFVEMKQINRVDKKIGLLDSDAKT